MRSPQIVGRRSAPFRPGIHDWLPIAAVGWAVVVGALIGVGGNLGLRGALLVSALPLVVAVVGRSTRGTLIGLAVWLVALGLIRRLVSSGTGAGVSHDPLLLVGPAALGALFVVSATRGAFRQRTPLASSVLLLSLLALVEAFNPLQGGFLIGLGGLLLVAFPMLAFWVGRVLVDRALLRKLLRLVSVLALLGAFYGLVQQFSGFPSWDLRWINSAGYTALNVNGFDRAFGSFSSAQEYAVFLCIGLVSWVALFRRGRLVWILFQLVAISLIVTAVVLESQRGAIVDTVLALGAMAAARTGRRPTGALLVGALFLLVLFFGLNQFASSSNTQATTTDSVSALTSHLVSGLANPTGQHSTLPGHFSILESGIESGFTEPIGHGTGSITLAANSLGNAALLGTEMDPSNAAEAFGFVGLLLYLFVAGLGLSAVYRLASRQRDPLAIAVLGVAVVTVFQWLNGDLYSVAWLFWLTLGWADFQQLEARLNVGSPDLPMAELPNALNTPNLRTASPQPRPQMRD
jgi:hypothetical protein